MNPFEGMDPQEIASAAIIGVVLAFFIIGIIVTNVRNGVWKVFGFLLVVVVVLGVLKWIRG